MKELTDEEFYKAPTIIQLIYMMTKTNGMVGYNTFKEAQEKHPEYFIKNKK